MLRATAAEGRTVLVSSHVLAEMAQTVNDVVVIHHGRVVKQGPVGELTGAARGATIVRSPDAEKLAGALRAAGAEVTAFEDGALNVEGMDAAAVGDAALAAGVAVHQLYEAQASLEDVFFELTDGEAGHVINLIRGEAIKMRSTRTAIGFTIAGVALTLLFVLVSTLADEPSTVSGKRDALTRGARCSSCSWSSAWSARPASTATARSRPRC